MLEVGAVSQKMGLRNLGRLGGFRLNACGYLFAPENRRS